MSTTMVPRARVILSMVALLASACASPQEKAAKDWCLAIRACQMIPIYPLSEDLRPGDVFLVQRPIGRQVSEYKSRGYLSLDDHRVRLTGLDYKRVYLDGYFADAFGKTPHPRPLRRESSATGNGVVAAGGADGDQPDAAPIEAVAPRVSFPTYNFAVDRSQGLSLAFPIQGVPVALNFLGAQKAVGTVAIADARTYAADATDLYSKLEEWSRQPDVRDHLAGAARASPKQVYLRVIKRVYLAGSVDVSIANTSSASGAGRAGVLSEQADDPNISTEDFEKSLSKQAKILTALQDVASKQGLGAAVKLTEVSDRSVSLRQAFDVPQVVGYLGMDVPVFEDGALGLPLPTFERLKGEVLEQEPQRVGELSRSQEEYLIRMKVLQLLAEKGDWLPALKVVEKVAAGLDDEAMKPLAENARTLAGPPPGASFATDAAAVVKAFRSAATAYVSQDGGSGPRYGRVIGLMDSAIVGQ